MSSLLGMGGVERGAWSVERSYRHGAWTARAGCWTAMRGSRHRNFVAYKLAAALADDLHDLVVTWTSFELWSVGIQLVRAADSVGANIAEGLGRETPPDERRFLVMARASLREVEHWLERAAARDLLGDERFEPRTTELGRVLSGLIGSGRVQGAA